MFTITKAHSDTIQHTVDNEPTDNLYLWSRQSRGYYDYTMYLKAGVPYTSPKTMFDAEGNIDYNTKEIVTFDQDVYLMKKTYDKMLGDDRQVGYECRYFTKSDTDIMKLITLYEAPSKQTLRFEPLEEEPFLRARILGTYVEETRNTSKRNSHTLYDYPTTLDFYEECDELGTLFAELYDVGLDYNKSWLVNNPSYQRPRHWTKQ